MLQDAQGPSGTARYPNLHPCPLCPQVLLGHPPPYAMDITAQVHTAPTPAAVLSPPLPEIVPPAAPELLPQLPSSLAPVMVAAAHSLPVQTTALLPPSNLPLPSGPGLSSSCPAVQLTVELAPEVCALPTGLGIQRVTPMPGPSISAAPLRCPWVSAPEIGLRWGRWKHMPQDSCGCRSSLLCRHVTLSFNAHLGGRGVTFTKRFRVLSLRGDGKASAISLPGCMCCLVGVSREG